MGAIFRASPEERAGMQRPDPAERNQAVEEAFGDVRRAMRLTRWRASEWNIDPDKIGVMGFSAGGIWQPLWRWITMMETRH